MVLIDPMCFRAGTEAAARGETAMALGVYDALAARGLRVPADVSVVGFDDRPEAQRATPPLTTVRQPTAEMGATAVKRLLEIARTDRNGPRSRSRLELSTDLIIRASTSQASRSCEALMACAPPRT